MSRTRCFKLEAHVTQNLNRALWLSLDTVISNGAATTTDGVPDDNDKYSWELGASLGVNLSQALSLKATYGQVIDRNENGLTARFPGWWRATSSGEQRLERADDQFVILDLRQAQTVTTATTPAPCTRIGTAPPLSA